MSMPETAAQLRLDVKALAPSSTAEGEAKFVYNTLPFSNVTAIVLFCSKEMPAMWTTDCRTGGEAERPGEWGWGCLKWPGTPGKGSSATWVRPASPSHPGRGSGQEHTIVCTSNCRRQYGAAAHEWLSLFCESSSESIPKGGREGPKQGASFPAMGGEAIKTPFMASE